jgi:hypothetical protein
MRDEMATVLRLVAEGTLSPEEAAPIIDALSRSGPPAAPDPSEPSEGTTGTTRSRRVRIQVNERGKKVVDVRVPLAFAAVAARMVPGIPENYAGLIEQAAESATIGTIVDTEDETGDGVVISTE